MFTIEAAASGIGYCTLALLLGSLMTAGFLLFQGEPLSLRRTLVSFSWRLLIFYVVISSCSLVIQGAKLEGGTFPTLDLLGRYLLHTQSGKIWLARLIYAILLVVGIFLFSRRSNDLKGIRLFLFLSLPLVASRSLTSHAVALRENMILAVSADAVHLMATGLWAGGLPVLLWALYQSTNRLHLPPAWTAATVGRFSRMALFSMALLVLTGIYQSWIEVGTVPILFETPYGQTLLLKLFLFLFMAALGGLNFFSTRPKLFAAAQSKELPQWLRRKTWRRIGGEALIGLGVLCLTGFLTVLPPGIHSLHQGNAGTSAGLQPYPARLNFFTWLGYLLTPAPKLELAEGAKVAILIPTEGQTFDSDEVPMKYEFVKGKRGNHLHAYVDGKLMGMFSNPDGGTLTGIQPGRHVLELRVTTEDHVTELDAKDQVRFTVKQ